MIKTILASALVAMLLFASPAAAKEPQYIIHLMTVHLEEYSVGDVPVLKTNTELQEIKGDTMQEAYNNCVAQLRYWSSRSDGTWVFFCWPLKNPNYVDGSAT